jgi:hypothetical protein
MGDAGVFVINSQVCGLTPLGQPQCRLLIESPVMRQTLARVTERPAISFVRTKASVFVRPAHRGAMPCTSLHAVARARDIRVEA